MERIGILSEPVAFRLEKLLTILRIAWTQGRILLKIQHTTICRIELGQRSGKNTMKEWSEHKINATLELSTLENPYLDTLFNLNYKFWIFHFFYIFEQWNTPFIVLSYLPN